MDTPPKKDFFKHVFNFDDESKSSILNLIQYTFLAIIPIVVLNKLMYKYVPEADEQKGSLEITGEIVLQILFLFLGLLLVHRIITYVPTYSGEDYAEIQLITSVLAVLIIILSLSTKLGDKINILFQRIYEMWNGPEPKQNKKKQIKTIQPMNTRINDEGTSISSLPTNEMIQSNHNASALALEPQQLPDYNNMYQQNNTPLVNAMEPMAANAVLGGSAFGDASW